jgi:hypothetical protein
MANEPVERPGSLLQSVTRMVEAAVNDGTGYEPLIPVLSLICLVSILGQGQPRVAQAAPSTATSPLQKLIGDLAKGDGGGIGPDTLVTLLPLLNSPQIKSKLNPATLGAVMSLLANMCDKSDKRDKGETAKQDKGGEKTEKGEEKRVAPPPTAATATTLGVLAEKQEGPDAAEGDKKGLGKYLNWKGNF